MKHESLLRDEQKCKVLTQDEQNQINIHARVAKSRAIKRHSILTY